MSLHDEKIFDSINELREALQKKNHGDSEFGPTPLNPPSPTSDREKKCRDSCVQI